MKALVMQAPWVLTVEEVSTPEPGPEDVLIKIVATGICGSDFHGFSGENGRRKPGQIMGHETVGHVVKVGGNVIDLVEGTCVTVNPVLSCDDCDVCRTGNEQSCPNRKVIGGGPIGQAAFLAARRLGATRVAVSDINPTRRALCAELGAAVIDPSAKPLEESIVDALGAKATLVIDAVGATSTLADAMRASAFGARVVLVGMAGPSVELAAFAISTEERTLIGSFCYSRKHFAETAAWGSRALRRASPNWPRARAKGARSWSSPAALPRLRLRGPDGYAEDRPGSCVHRGSQGRCRLSRPGGVPLDRRPHRHPDGEVPGICRQPPQLRYRRPGHPCR